ncbi:hypothetical protein HK102_010303, partial [Quaeritorhiza haematococci]
MVTDLYSTAEGVLKKTLFLLQKYLKEPEFVDEFLNRNGVERLKEVICGAQGNTLAYALTSLLALMEHDYGWEEFEGGFISTLVSIIVKQNLVNICRPATAIVIKLVNADKSSPTAAIQNYGFDIINNAISSQPSFLPTLVQRLSATDYLLQLNSMHLINTLFRHAIDGERLDFVRTLLDELRIRDVVLKLLQGSPAEELGKQLVEFQRLLVQEAHRRKRVSIMQGLAGVTAETLLNEIWAASKMQVEVSMKWRKLGFYSENPKKELSRVGLFGLESMYTFATQNSETFIKLLGEQANRSSDRRCPFARVAIEVSEILADYWEISTG